MDNGYSICLNEWALDKEIKNELGLLLIISSLCAEKGYCYASNKFFTEIFDIDETNVSKKIKKLEKKNYITIEYLKNGNATYLRKIRLAKIPIAVGKNTNGNKNNISNNNINNNKRFQKPTKIEIETYANENNLTIDADYFIDYYESKGWLVGKTPMKNWKSAVRNWCRNDKKYDRAPSDNSSNTHFEWVTRDGQVSLERVSK